MAYSHSIDDADPRITYSTAWDFITSDQYTMPQWSGTAHSTSTIGTTARLRFTGSAIAVICIIPTSGGGNGVSRASFSIDNGPAKEVHIPTTLPVQFEVEFWNSGPLPFGPHSLVITNIGNDAYFRLDRIDYDPTDSHSPSSSPPPRTLTVTQIQNPQTSSDTLSRSSSPVTSQSNLGTSRSDSNSASVTGRLSSSDLSSLSTSGLSSASGSNTVPFQQPSSGPLILGGGNSGSATGATSSESEVPIAAIVGGTLGGLLILLFIVFVIIVRRRRSGQTPQRLSDEPSATTPFNIESSHHTSNSSGMASWAPNLTAPASKAAMLGFPLNSSPQQVYSAQSGSGSDIYASSSNYSTEPSPDGTLATKEVISSIPVNRESVAVSEAPPAYHTPSQQPA